jgi:hypothetical protein
MISLFYDDNYFVSLLVYSSDYVFHDSLEPNNYVVQSCDGLDLLSIFLLELLYVSWELGVDSLYDGLKLFFYLFDFFIDHSWDFGLVMFCFLLYLLDCLPFLLLDGYLELFVQKKQNELFLEFTVFGIDSTTLRYTVSHFN